MSIFPQPRQHWILVLFVCFGFSFHQFLFHFVCLLYPKCIDWDAFPFILIQGLLVLLPSEGASFCKPCFSSCRLAEDSRAANTQNYCVCMLAKDGGWFYSVLGISHPWSRNLGSAPGASFCVSSSPLLERDEGDPLHVLVGRWSPPFTSFIVKKLHCFILHIFDCQWGWIFFTMSWATLARYLTVYRGRGKLLVLDFFAPRLWWDYEA